MQILHTHSISAAVIDLIRESQKYCYLVTPYIRPWPLLRRALEVATETRKRITLIVRNEKESLATSRRLHADLAIEVYAFDRLHTKLYLNEKAAVVSSMNLFDSSNESNFEVAILWKDPGSARRLKEEVIDHELLRLPPKEHLKGWFNAEEDSRSSGMRHFERQLDQRGFCVTCGIKMDFDRDPSVLSARITRCKPCWAQAPLIDEPNRFRIRNCHYCGEQLSSVLTFPFHDQCHAALKAFREWQREFSGKFRRPIPAR
jgi:hypothetical protein